MSNSRLIVYDDSDTEKHSDRTGSITRITIHSAGNVLSLEDFSSLIRYTSNTSWHYAIANDGSIGFFLDESYASWTSNNADNDDKAVNIMVSLSAQTRQEPISAAAYQSLIYLCEDICRRNNISRLRYTGKLAGSNITMHKWFVPSLTCPGAYISARYKDIVQRVNARLALPDTLPYVISSDVQTVTSYDYLQTGTVQFPISWTDPENLTPYIATISRNTPDFNIRRLQDMGVVGMCVEAGTLFNVVHQQQVFKSPRFDVQIAQIENADMPFALYAPVRARNIAEAQQEMYHFSFIIRQHPPMLGVWLKLELPGSVSVNNSIMETYYTALVRLGLMDSIGIYVTRQELQQITWDNFYPSWYLWLNDHVDTMDDLDQLLTPYFFMLNEEGEQ